VLFPSFLNTELCRKNRASYRPAKLHGFFWCKTPVFKKYGIKTIFSFGVGTISPGENIGVAGSANGARKSPGIVQPPGGSRIFPPVYGDIHEPGHGRLRLCRERQDLPFLKGARDASPHVNHQKSVRISQFSANEQESRIAGGPENFHPGTGRNPAEISRNIYGLKKNSEKIRKNLPGSGLLDKNK
jgi:hypothetical protein